MTAAQAAAFDQVCLDSSVALWPGSVTFGSSATEYPCAILVGSGEATVNAGGIQAEEIVTIEISRDLLVTAPGIGTMVEDVATGKRYEIYRVLPEAARWLIRAAIFPQA
jgi:hypothetical protein